MCFSHTNANCSWEPIQKDLQGHQLETAFKLWVKMKLLLMYLCLLLIKVCIREFFLSGEGRLHLSNAKDKCRSHFNKPSHNFTYKKKKFTKNNKEFLIVEKWTPLVPSISSEIYTRSSRNLRRKKICNWTIVVVLLLNRFYGKVETTTTFFKTTLFK